MAFGPAFAALPGADRSSVNRFVLEQPLQIFGQVFGARVALFRLLLETLEANDIQIAGYVRLKYAGRDWVAHHRLHQGIERVVRLERGASRERVIQDCAERVDV